MVQEAEDAQPLLSDSRCEIHRLSLQGCASTCWASRGVNPLLSDCQYVHYGKHERAPSGRNASSCQKLSMVAFEHLPCCVCSPPARLQTVWSPRCERKQLALIHIDFFSSPPKQHLRCSHASSDVPAWC